MPQFDMSFLVGQIFWLVVSFGGLYLGIQFIVFPMFNRIFSKRTEYIQGTLNRAKQLIQETEKMEIQLEKKNKIAEQRQIERLNQAHQDASDRMQETLKKTDQTLNNSLKRTIRKMELETQNAIQKSSHFSTQVMKGVK